MKSLYWKVLKKINQESKIALSEKEKEIYNKKINKIIKHHNIILITQHEKIIA